MDVKKMINQVVDFINRPTRIPLPLNDVQI